MVDPTFSIAITSLEEALWTSKPSTSRITSPGRKTGAREAGLPGV